MCIDVVIGGVMVIFELLFLILNYGQLWVYIDMEIIFGMLCSEYDVSQNWIVYGFVGVSCNEEIGQYGVLMLMNNNGDVIIFCLYVLYVVDFVVGLGGICGYFDIGLIIYKVNLGYVVNYWIIKLVWNMFG